MQKEKQLKLVLTKAGITCLVLLAIAAIYNTNSDGATIGAGKVNIEDSDPTTSILYDKMFYEFAGVTGIYGLGSFGSNGYVRYSHESGDTFVADYYDDYMGESPYTVNNNTRIRDDGMHDIFWIFNNVTVNDTVVIRNPLAVADQSFTVLSEANQTVAGTVYLCWYLTGPTSSVAYYHKASGLLIYAEFRIPYGGYTFFQRFTLSRSNAPNDSPPTLTSGQVVPPSGNTTTVFRYNVNYTDPDNHDPEFVNVVIDGVVHAMTKENATDTNYTDSVAYYYQTPLTNTTHSFFFNASDWRFTVATTTYDGPNPVSKLTDTPPALAFLNLYPTTGHVGVNFRFRVNYADADNDIPLWVNMTINGTVVSMVKLDPDDHNYIDGVVYECFNTPAAPGTYALHFNATDGTNQVGTPATPIAGPVVWAPYEAPSPLFNGAYMNYSGTYDAYYTFRGGTNYTFMSGNTFQARHYNYLSPYYSTLTVDNRTRYFTAGVNIWGTSGYDWVWIFKNVSLTDTIPIAIYQGSYRNFTVTGEGTRTRLSKTFNCWVLQDTMGSTAYYDKNAGLFIEGSFVTSGGIPYNMYITDTNIPDVSPPTLTGGIVTPTIGDMSTSFVFNVTYTDPDNNHPTYVRITIDGVTYSMTKLVAGDTNYTDGCVYQYVTTLQNISYSFYFAASDGHYSARDPAAGTIAGPEVWKSNLNPAVLGNVSLLPKYVTEWDTYYFRVTYTDSDNIGPSYVNLVVYKDGSPYGTFSMAQENPSDLYYPDGANFTLSRQFELGNYSYYFTTNDTKYVTTLQNGTSYFNDLLVTSGKTPFFDGMYYDFYISMYMGYYGYGSVHFTMVNTTAYRLDKSQTIVMGGTPLTTTSWSIFDIRSRRILSSSSSTNVGRQNIDTIWNNTRVGTITNMESYGINYGYYPCVGSANVTALSQTFDCWRFQVGGDWLCFEKKTGMFLYSFKNVGMGYNFQTTVTATNMVFGNDPPVATGGSAINNTSIPMNHTGDYIDWTITDPEGNSGTYSVLVNGTQYIGWTAWTSGSAFQVPVDTNRGLGTFNYTLQYQDVYEAFGDESHVYITVIDAPTSNQPSDQIALANSTGVTIDWVLQDKIGAGMYRVLMNGTEYITWTAWMNDTSLGVPVDCDVGLGDWNYTIQFDNSRDSFGIPDTVIITVNDLPAASLSLPVNGTVYGKNETGHVIPWVVDDLEGGTGTYNVSINGSFYLSGAWTSGMPIPVLIDTNRGLGWFNYTFSYSDVHGARGIDSHAYIAVINVPTSNSPADQVLLVNSTGVTIDWVLQDEIGVGNYRVLVNGTEYITWTAWTNDTSLDVPVDCNIGLGDWNYTIQFNNSQGGYGIPDTVIITVNDLPVASLVIPTDGNYYPRNATSYVIPWVIDDLVGGTGTYNASINGSFYLSGEWTSGMPIPVLIDTNRGLGWFNYTLYYSDGHGARGTDNHVLVRVVCIPSASQPGDVVYLRNAASVPIAWNLTDEFGSGQYRVLRNGVVLVPWMPWTNGSGIDVPVDTSLSVGYWNYTIQFNNSAGQFGIQDVVIVTIDDLPFVVQTPAILQFDQNSTNTITWVLRDRIGAGTFTLYVNGTAHPGYTNVAWVNNSAVSIIVNTNSGLGMFNYTLRYYDANGFEGAASMVVITIVTPNVEIPEDPFIAFLRAYWLFLVSGIAALVAILAVVGARRKKKVVGAKKKGKRETPMPKKAPQYSQPGDMLASSLATKKVATPNIVSSSLPPASEPEQPATFDIAASPISEGTVQVDAAPGPTTAKFYCIACKTYFDIPEPDFVGWYTCPTCTRLLVHVVDCPTCGESIALNKADYALFRGTGLSCPGCNRSIKI